MTKPGPTTTNYTWDNNGDLTTRGSDSFAWDYEDRMTSATVGGTTTTFAYRGDGIRESRTTGGVTTTFNWDVNEGLPVVLGDGTSNFVYGAGLTSMKQGGNWYYYLADGLGSTMAIVNASGTVQNTYTYDVYGKATKTGTLANEFDFAGQQTDTTGLQYLRARYMDPETGTFLSRDPLAVSPRWTAHGSGYASNNPALATDPSGLCNYPGDPSDPWCKEQSKGPKVAPGYGPAPKPVDPWIDTPAIFGKVLDGVTTFAGVVKDAGIAYIALSGEYELQRLQAQTELANVIVRGLEAAQDCASDSLCSQWVEALLQEAAGTALYAGLASGNPALLGLAGALETAAAAWSTYSAAAQRPQPEPIRGCILDCPIA